MSEKSNSKAESHKSTKSHLQTKKAPTGFVKVKKRSSGTWFIRNAALVIVAYVLISKIPSMNESYQWLWEGYVKQNIEIAKQYPDISYDEKMQMKLGADYQYLMFLRDNTPKNAIIYYPTAGDFRAGVPGQQQNPFNGKLNDKLTAVRVLYPRRVVTVDEYGKTSWSKKINYVGIMNGKNVEKVKYKVPANYIIGVLPVNQPPKQVQQ